MDGTTKLNPLKSVLVRRGIGGFNASDVMAGTITNVFEKNLILFSKGKIKNYKKREHTAQIQSGIIMFFVSATIAVYY